MNNLIHLNYLDPIFNEYEGFVDKDAGLKTIAFKYFGADINEASEYLKVTDLNPNIANNNFSIISSNTTDTYYQPELI
ncbi:hypothetical protein N9Y44_00415 [Gammaproteobacteria bacterium]|nr:hypothetical protein [Gammaproteobacteria bacterium]